MSKAISPIISDLEEISTLIDIARKERIGIKLDVNSSDIFEKAKEQLQEHESSQNPLSNVDESLNMFHLRARESPIEIHKLNLKNQASSILSSSITSANQVSNY